MTLKQHAQTRDDLNRADAVIRACWDNFKATEPTFVLRDLIVIELHKAREMERERCAKIAEDYDGNGLDGTFMQEGGNAALTAREIAALIRA